MLKIILVGIGGFFGSACRYIITGSIQRIPLLETFPWGTFAVNIGGCFLIGLLSGLLENRQFFSPETRLFILVGFLGGFTTFSTFGLESYSFLRDGQWL